VRIHSNISMPRVHIPPRRRRRKGIFLSHMWLARNDLRLFFGRNGRPLNARKRTCLHRSAMSPVRK
jgi:hypothetical protein